MKGTYLYFQVKQPRLLLPGESRLCSQLKPCQFLPTEAGDLCRSLYVFEPCRLAAVFIDLTLLSGEDAGKKHTSLLPSQATSTSITRREQITLAVQANSIPAYGSRGSVPIRSMPLGHASQEKGEYARYSSHFNSYQWKQGLYANRSMSLSHATWVAFFLNPNLLSGEDAHKHIFLLPSQATSTSITRRRQTTLAAQAI